MAGIELEVKFCFSFLIYYDSVKRLGQLTVHEFQTFFKPIPVKSF